MMALETVGQPDFAFPKWWVQPHGERRGEETVPLPDTRGVGNPPTEDELSTLRIGTSVSRNSGVVLDTSLSAIGHLGGIVPQLAAAANSLPKSARQKRSRAERCDYFCALRDLVSPEVSRIREKHILKKGMRPLLFCETWKIDAAVTLQ
jgi:hypothetical protein